MTGTFDAVPGLMCLRRRGRSCHELHGEASKEPSGPAWHGIDHFEVRVDRRICLSEHDFLHRYNEDDLTFLT